MYSGVQGKNNEYHIVDKVQNSFIDALIFDLIDNVVFVVFALYSSTGVVGINNVFLIVYKVENMCVCGIRCLCLVLQNMAQF